MGNGGTLGIRDNTAFLPAGVDRIYWGLVLCINWKLKQTHGYFSYHASTNEPAAQSCTILEQGVSCVFKGLFAFVPTIYLYLS